MMCKSRLGVNLTKNQFYDIIYIEKKERNKMRKHSVKKAQRRFNKHLRDLRSVINDEYKLDDGSPRFEIKQFSRENHYSVDNGFIYGLLFVDKKTGESEEYRDYFWIDYNHGLEKLFISRIFFRLNDFIAKCIESCG